MQNLMGERIKHYIMISCTKTKQKAMMIISDKIMVSELREMAQNLFGNMVKAVVDIQKGVMAVDAELHADEEAMLLETGSRQEDLWGINIYPDLARGDPNFVEFDSMINLRPSQNNRSRGVENAETRMEILSIVEKLVV
jgi:hypothetical protein